MRRPSDAIGRRRQSALVDLLSAQRFAWPMRETAAALARAGFTPKDLDHPDALRAYLAAVKDDDPPSAPPAEWEPYL